MVENEKGCGMRHTVFLAALYALITSQCFMEIKWRLLLKTMLKGLLHVMFFFHGNTRLLEICTL